LTIASFAEEMLVNLGDPYPHRGTLPSRSRRIDDALRNKGSKGRGIQLVALNEFQHFVDSRWGVPYEVADWLKDRIEESGKPHVIFGLEYGLDVLDENEQLKGLFDETIKIEALNWKIADDRKTFRGILKALKTELADSYEFPEEMEEVDLAFRLCHGSFGLIGYLMKIIRGAAAIARREHTTKITKQMLADAYRVHVRGKDPQNPNPFTDPKFSPDTAPEVIPPRDSAAKRRMAPAKRGRKRAPRLSASGDNGM
jgi:hypothetical protein